MSSADELEKEICIGPPELTKYERARIIETRTLQIAMGAPILIPPDEAPSDPILIAIMELERGILPITIRRMLPDGSSQDIPLRALLGREVRKLN
ncbi:MAG TPA: DNA-directed RNA polymerase subunit K [Candidatus Bathyarchaeota archaeon]|nr:DNA-directed RNA polymerase subunit K [Candidatus Bathyarchaeota archaeon]